MTKWIDVSEMATYQEVSQQEVQESMTTAIAQVAKNIATHATAFPAPSSQDDFYEFGENVEWTTGFWTGEIWLAYENTADKQEKALFAEIGKKHIRSFDERITNKIDVDHHDMGFLYIPSCVAGYQLVGDERGRVAALKAADHLMSRYQEKGEFLQAWGTLGAKDNYRLIIDCLLNVPLLYWATVETGDPHYSEIAAKHIHTTMTYIFREDNSTWHTAFFDTETGAFDRGETAQGYKDDSAWARGQAWGIYGSALAYKHTKDARYIADFKKAADFYLAYLPTDLCPFWDLSFGMGDEKTEPRDSSSAAIVICGFLEMSHYLEGEEAQYYRSLAKKMLKSLIDHYQVKDYQASNGQLLHGTYAKQSPYNTCIPGGVDECVIWGDYFFMEALTRLLQPDWHVYW